MGCAQVGDGGGGGGGGPWGGGQRRLHQLDYLLEVLLIPGLVASGTGWIAQPTTPSQNTTFYTSCQQQLLMIMTIVGSAPPITKRAAVNHPSLTMPE